MEDSSWYTPFPLGTNRALTAVMVATSFGVVCLSSWLVLGRPAWTCAVDGVGAASGLFCALAALNWVRRH